MENQFEKIANLQLKLSDNYSELDKEIIEKYWEIDNGEFVNSPRLIKRKYNVSKSELTNIIKSYSELSFYVYCQSCISYEHNNVESQTRFKNVISSFNKSYSKKSRCKECFELERKEKEAERIKREEKLLDNLNTAINNRNWENLSNFEKGVLKNGLRMNFDNLKKYYGKLLGYNQYMKFIGALKNIEQQYLFVLKRNHINYIIDHDYLPRLMRLENEIIIENQRKPKQNSVINYSRTNELKIRLTIDNERNHPDSPLYSGTVIFKEEIVLKSGIEYAFGHWERANNNLYLTLVPTSEIEKQPIQRPLSKVPISLQEGIRNYFNSIGRNLDF